MRFRLKSGFSSSVALVASVACSGSVDTQTGTTKDQDASSEEGGRSSGSGGGIGTAGAVGAGGTRVGTGGQAHGGVPNTGGRAGGDGGAAGDQGTGGIPGTGGDKGTGGATQRGTGGVGGDSATTGTLLAPCAVVGAYGCAGHAQKGQLVCTGTWAANGNCTGSDNCDTTPGATAGSCQPIAYECLGKKPGDKVCQGADSLQCGPDLVTVTLVETCQQPDAGVELFCEDGVCKFQ